MSPRRPRPGPEQPATVELPPNDAFATASTTRPAEPTRAPAKRTRRTKPASTAPAPAGQGDAEPTESTRDRYGRGFRDRGGVDLWANSSQGVHYWAVPASDDPDEPEAELWALSLATEDATPQLMRTFPRPRAVVLHEGERRALVRTRDGVDVMVTADQEDRHQWLGRCGGRRPGTRREQDIIGEGFACLKERVPVWDPKIRADADGRLSLPPRGVQPPGWQAMSPEVKPDAARDVWAEWLALAVRQPGGTLVHLAAAVIDSLYLGHDRRQSHTIDVVSRDLHIGKSVGLQCCGAIVGDPDVVVMPLDAASPISVATLGGQVGFGSLFLDESQLFDGSAQDRGLMVFRLAQTGRRLRAQSDGSAIRQALPFTGVTVITGNLRFVDPVTLESQMPGLARRYLVFTPSRETPVTASDIDATELVTLARRAAGHLAPMVLDAVTAPEHHAAHVAYWRELQDTYPAESPEVLRLFAGHLAGARALDVTLGVGMPAGVNAVDSVREHIRAWIRDGGGGDMRPLHVKFLDDVREHIAIRPEQWPTPEQYAAHQRPDLATRDDESDPAAGRSIREPVGIRWPDGQRFAILGKPALRRLCELFGILDTDAVLAGLRDAGWLHRAASTAREGDLQANVNVARLAGAKVQARVYDIRAAWQAPGDDDDQSDGPAPDDPAGPAVTEPPAAPVGPLDPFTHAQVPDEPQSPSASASGPVPARAAEHPRQARNGSQRGAGDRPEWMPDRLRRGSDGSWRDVVATVNRLMDTQDKRGRAQVHRHPYPKDRDVPEPLRLRGRGMGTSVHEGAHNWTDPELAPGTAVTVLDRNAAYLAALGTAELPIAGLTAYDGRGPAKQAGVHRLAGMPELTAAGAGLPHPLGQLTADRDGGPLWIPSGTLRLADDQARAGIITPPDVVESLTGAPLQRGRSAVARWEWMARALRDERARAIEAGDADTESFLKAVYAVLVSTAGESTANTRVWRPELPPIVRSTAAANLWRQAAKLRAAGVRVVALTGTDEIHVAAEPGAVFAALGQDGKPVVVEGRGLAEIKVKGGYVVGPDGDPVDVWEGSRHGE